MADPQTVLGSALGAIRHGDDSAENEGRRSPFGGRIMTELW